MHEMSLAEGVLQIIEDNARNGGYARVKTVWLEIGQLAGVEVEAMKFCFDAVTRNTLADGARLQIIATDGEGRCPDCHKTVKLVERYDPCPECGGFPVEITGGTEMRVKQLEVE
ncbi:MAG: hydrogenase maturation nickel metallochaperone HypA [Sulfurimicrobium sp.]